MRLRVMNVAAVVLCGALSVGCSAAAMQAFADHYAAQERARALAAASQRLLLFGGEGHEVFLGCVSCSAYDSSSIFNEYGAHGSNYSSTSIANKFSDYGSRYSTHSACNPLATDPPIIVTGDGQALGRLTMNRYNADAVRVPELLKWLTAICED